MMAKPQMWWPGISHQHPLARDLIGIWPMWEGAGSRIMDVSVLRGDGILTNMNPATDWVGSRHGHALSFDGVDDHVLVGNLPLFTAPSSFSLFVLFKRNGTSADNSFPRLIGKGNSTNSDGEWSLFVNDSDAGSTQAGFRFIDPGGSAHNLVHTTLGAINTDWHTLGVSYRNGAQMLYVDGRKVKNQSVTEDIRDVGSTIQIGTSASIRHFNGLISLVVAHARRLGKQEFRELHENPFGMLRIPPIARTLQTLQSKRHDRQRSGRMTSDLSITNSQSSLHKVLV